MRRRHFITALGLGTVATASAGCLDDFTSSAEPGDLTIERLDDLDVERTDRSTIEVQGVGTVEAEPNKAELSVGLEASDRESADAVVEELAAKSEQLMATLVAAGIDEGQIETTNYSLRHNGRRGRYEGSHRYRIDVDDPDAVGDVIDLVADSTADEIHTVRFTITADRRETLHEQAVSAAVEDAKSEAQLYAQAADVTLGAPVSIETTRSGVSPFDRHFALATDDATEVPPTQLERGDVTVTATVTIVYEFSNEA